MTTLFINIFLTAAPISIVLVWLIRNKSKSTLTPAEILLSFAAGIIIIFPASMVEFTIYIYTSGITGFLKIFIQAFIIAALIEETAKFLALRLIFYLKNRLRLSAALHTSIAVGLGFAFLENVMYSFDPSIIVMLRSVSAVPLHVFTTGIIGYYLWKKRTEENFGSSSISFIHFRGFFEAFMFHGFYGMFIALKSGISFLSIFVLIAAGYRFYTLCFSDRKDSA